MQHIIGKWLCFSFYTDSARDLVSGPVAERYWTGCIFGHYPKRISQTSQAEWQHAHFQLPGASRGLLQSVRRYFSDNPKRPCFLFFFCQLGGQLIRIFINKLLCFFPGKCTDLVKIMLRLDRDYHMKSLRTGCHHKACEISSVFLLG